MENSSFSDCGHRYRDIVEDFDKLDAHIDTVVTLFPQKRKPAHQSTSVSALKSGRTYLSTDHRLPLAERPD